MQGLGLKVFSWVLVWGFGLGFLVFGFWASGFGFWVLRLWVLGLWVLVWGLAFICGWARFRVSV